MTTLPKGWTEVALGDVAEQVRGVSYKKEEAASSPGPDRVPVLRAGNLRNDGRVDTSDLVWVPKSCVSDRQRLQPGDVIVATSSGSLDVVGKAARYEGDLLLSFGAFCKVMRPAPGVDRSYFGHYFQTSSYRRILSSLAAGANINNLKNSHLDGLRFPLPPLGEQRRIAAILDKADELRAKRRAASEQLDSLTQAIFLDMFGDPVTNLKQWPESRSLGEVADVVSGITKGRRTSAPTRAVPYLAVANVQDKKLLLDSVKSIDATEAEIERYRLRPGDVLLTEGGDPDKLGRGTVWREELPEAIHQNHIFRVRPDSKAVTPDFLAWLVGSERGKRYFLRSAKQTTGIASINATQLRAFPLLLPPLERQLEFDKRVSQARTTRARADHANGELEWLVRSLQSRAFRGEL